MLPIQPLKGEWRRPDLRNHRKILVVDGLVAFTGSQNLIEPGYNKPKNHKRRPRVGRADGAGRGPDGARAQRRLRHRLVHRDRRACSTEDDVVPTRSPSRRTRSRARWCRAGRASPTENNLRLFNDAALLAPSVGSRSPAPTSCPTSRCCTPSRPPPSAGSRWSCSSSEAGDQFMVYHAQRSYYEALLDAGVRIWLYPAPYILHAKHFSVDDDVAVIGSSNMDMRSFALNYEVSLDAPRRRRRASDAQGRGHLPGALPRAHPRGVGPASREATATSTT